MRKRNWLLVMLAMLALVLETLPWGVRMSFVDGFELGTTLDDSLSFFSLGPVAYGDVWHLTAAGFTCFALLLALANCFAKGNWGRFVVAGLSGLALICSLADPIFLGFDWWTLVGVLVSMALLALTVVALLPGKRQGSNPNRK